MRGGWRDGVRRIQRLERYRPAFGVSHDTVYRWIATGQLAADLDEEAARARTPYIG